MIDALEDLEDVQNVYHNVADSEKKNKSKTSLKVYLCFRGCFYFHFYRFQKQRGISFGLIAFLCYYLSN